MGEKERDREKREGEEKEGKEEGGKREGQREENTALHSLVLKPWASLQRVYLTGSLEKKKYQHVTLGELTLGHCLDSRPTLFDLYKKSTKIEHQQEPTQK